MPRRKSVNFIRPVGTDPRYGSETVQKLINVVMWRGKKNVARKIVYEALESINKRVGGSRDKSLETFLKGIEQLVPTVEVRPRRVGGSVYQIPMEVPYNRGRALAMRWLIEAASKRPDKTMGLRIGNEILDANEGRGLALKKKLDVHKMADSNRAFAHYAW